MANLTIKQVKNILNDFKDSLYISISLESFKANHYDFFEFLETNEEFKKDYEKILNYNNILLEDRVAQQCYSGKGNPKILLEMLKANNKKKYNIKQEVELSTSFKNLTDVELDQMIEKIQKNLT